MVQWLKLIVYHHTLHMWYRVVYIGGISAIQILLKNLSWRRQRQQLRQCWRQQQGGIRRLPTLVNLEAQMGLIKASSRPRVFLEWRLQASTANHGFCAMRVWRSVLT
jgi:hypothetical protein